MYYRLYGDGIHDDTLAIQELIDSTKGILTLPQPEECILRPKDRSSACAPYPGHETPADSAAGFHRK